jgi:hypothetical protein
MGSCLGRSTVHSDKLSPDGSYEAELIEGDTGAVGAWEFAARIREANPGTWSRLLGRDRNTVFGLSLRSTHITMKWTDDHHLTIVCTGCEPNQVEVRKAVWHDVTVDYEINWANSRGP